MPENAPCGPSISGVSSVFVQATFSFETFEVLIWPRPENRAFARSPEDMLQSLPLAG